jgi:hypothetical protein
MIKEGVFTQPTYVIGWNNDEPLAASFPCLPLRPDQIPIPNGRAACRSRRDFYRLPFKFVDNAERDFTIFVALVINIELT